MIAASFTVALFAALWVVGLALLSAIRADTSSLRVALTAPAVGSALTILPLFVLSHVGFGMSSVGRPFSIALLTASAVVLALRRPHLPRGLWLVPLLGLADLALVARPMLQLGFRWVANANDDMANYVLSATQLLHHGLLGPVDFAGIARDSDYISAYQVLHNAGSRPGADIMLSAFSGTTGRPPYDLFMPLIVALNMVTICSVGALAMQASHRRSAAVIAAGLLAASPLAAFGVLQQLLPQVWGLGLAAALSALLMRRELHHEPGPTIQDIVLISLLCVAFAIVYVELMAALLSAYLLYVAVLAVRRRLAARSLALLWSAPLALALIVMNRYFFRTVQYVLAQAHGGMKSTVAGTSATAPLFGFTLIPAGLPGLLGIQKLPTSPSAHLLSLSIFVAILLIAAGAVGVLFSAWRGMAAATVLVMNIVLGLSLWAESSDFGMYKLYMYVQPFLAAVVAVWFVGIPRRRWIVLGGAFGALIITAQLSTLTVYVSRSKNPIDLHDASSPDLLPVFRRFFYATHLPVISTTDNPVLGKLEIASIGNRPLHFMGKNIFLNFVSAKRSGWQRSTFNVMDGRTKDSFLYNPRTSELLATGRCVIVIPAGSQVPVNRRMLPEASADLSIRPCREAKDLLVFTSSNLGQGFYLPQDRSRVALYQLEHDTFYPHRTFAGIGRYVLFRVLRSSGPARLEFTFTNTVRQNGSNALPSASVVGAKRVQLPVVGRGSMRVFSPPMRPQIIDGQPYLLLDVGVSGRVLTQPRSGLQGLYGRSVSVDPRYLTGYVRDISLVTEKEFRTLRPPTRLRNFPADLGNPNLEYSGIYEDGWMAEHAYVVLSGGRRASFVLKANVLHYGGRQHLEVTVNGHRIASRAVKPGPLTLRVALPASTSRRKIELHWAGASRLRSPDLRPAVAHLSLLGITHHTPPASISTFPTDLRGLQYRGVYDDGWLARDAYAVLRGGGAATLDLKALVPARDGGQRLTVTVNGRRVADESVKPGSVNLRIPLSASTTNRRIELRWAGTIKLKAPDPRHAAALLRVLSVAPTPPAPRSIGHFPADLGSGLAYKGIYDDGWLARDSFAVLAGGRPAVLTVRAQVPQRADGQHLDILVNGKRLISTDVKPGDLDLHADVPASAGKRRVELRWAGTIPLKKPDTRRAAARLKQLSVVPQAAPPTKIDRFPYDLKQLDYRGIWDDGWLAADSFAVLAGGPAATLDVAVNVPPRKGGQHLDVLINGQRLESKNVKPGDVEVKIRVPASSRPRRIELRFAGTIPLQAPDTRHAAALLKRLEITAG